MIQMMHHSLPYCHDLDESQQMQYMYIMQVHQHSSCCVSFYLYYYGSELCAYEAISLLLEEETSKRKLCFMANEIMSSFSLFFISFIELRMCTDTGGTLEKVHYWVPQTGEYGALLYIIHLKYDKFTTRMWSRTKSWIYYFLVSLAK